MTLSSHTTFQASAVAIDGRAVLITGPPGSGKSMLALALIDRGATLIGDDGIVLRKFSRQVIAEPHPNIAGKLEIRGVGLIDFPTTSAPVALIVNLDDIGERLPEALCTQDLLGCAVPVLPLGASDAAALPLRTEWGLRVHALTKESA
ncbi:HPr kinase/phosphorylase [Altererythrobacter sp. GH1-8]|uniref:HPr kinase/phosphorylase n=1 Tax=Altererythrobacter sp. GH1-8 TaxID=3349333 RepID=UPI00374D5EA8